MDELEEARVRAQLQMTKNAMPKNHMVKNHMARHDLLKHDQAHAQPGPCA